MINSFISLVARDLLKREANLREVAVIFPNLRSGSVFRNALVNHIDNPTWSPGIFSIDVWLTGLSGLQRIDRPFELALLFPVVKKHLPKIGTFADFMDLGETLLSDFEDTDKYLADATSLFANLHEIKKIDYAFGPAADEEVTERLRKFWGSFGQGQTKHQELWMETWEKLYQIYSDFTDHLAEKGLGTSGMCYRKAVAQLLSGQVSPGPFSKIYFAGFNILTGSEEAVFSHLKNSGKGGFYWDYHPYYLNPSFEAGKFINTYLKKYPPPDGFIPWDIAQPGFLEKKDGKKRVSVFPVTSNSGQIQTLLSQINRTPVQKRGIILSDEGLFSDLLSSWPDDKLEINLTSGYPMQDTLMAGLVKNISDIYLDLSRTSKDGCKSELILSFLRHPWAEWIAGSSTAALVSQIQICYPSSVPVDFLIREALLKPIVGFDFSAGTFLRRMLDIVQLLQKHTSELSSIEIAALEKFFTQLGNIRDLDMEYRLNLDLWSVIKLLSGFIHSSKISLETDREASNQVLGILETRLLDFDEIYILSFNEGIWPSKHLSPSLIPYSLRRAFRLPTAENRDAMYAYYFYRLIQRASTINLLYLTGHRDDGIRSGERSRFITQLEFELPESIHFFQEPAPWISTTSAVLSIPKEGGVLESLTEYLGEGIEVKSLSPSAINEYLDCPLKFALHRLYKIKEPDAVIHVSEPRGLGTLVHRVMEELYNPYLISGTAPDPRSISKLLANDRGLNEVIRKAYNRLMVGTGRVEPGGKEMLGLEVAQRYIRKILAFDHDVPPLRILGLEKEFLVKYPVRIKGIDSYVRLYGVFDRIDEVPGGVRIIDYKTGNCELNVKTLEDMFSPIMERRPKEAFQVCVYCEMYMRESEKQIETYPSLFRLGRFMAGETEYRIRLRDEEVGYSEIRTPFNTGFQNLLATIFDPQIPFSQTENDKKCRYCIYSGLCKRENYS